MIYSIVSLWLKFFFLFTPFFALSMFLAMTAGRPEAERRALAARTALATVVIAGLLLFFGRTIFHVFGLTVDSFRIGAGVLLFLTAVSLMNPKVISDKHDGEDISVVPLAMPVIVGPASCGAIMVMSAEMHTLSDKFSGFFALVTALAAVWGILALGTKLEKCLGRRGISILMRITALILAALSAQMIMTGVCGFIKA